MFLHPVDIKLSLQSPAVLVALAAVVFLAAVGHLDKRLAKLDRTAAEVAAALNSLVEIQAGSRDDGDSKSARAAAAAVAFAEHEIYSARPGSDELGIGLFSIRNVGSSAVFRLQLRASSFGLPASAVAQVLGPGESVTLSIMLGPDDAPLVLDDVTLWYQDTTGNLWYRRYRDEQAAQLPAPEERESERSVLSGEGEQ
ncbi:hypothetical protein [Streptomyces griseus]|uniref:hypothetical protein n=1 Tax=Streptomyces griseus TaxID=1911 RepID=UPI00055BD30D|nr:hypothetical protein [Streptomyces griseus]